MAIKKSYYFWSRSLIFICDRDFVASQKKKRIPENEDDKNNNVKKNERKNAGRFALVFGKANIYGGCISSSRSWVLFLAAVILYSIFFITSG